MSEGLKFARYGTARLAVEQCMQSGEYETPQYWERVRIVELALRELQKQAMEMAIRRVAAVQIKHGLGGLHVEAFSAAELDWLLDEPPPHFPVRCIHCGQIEEAHAIVAHAFEPQSPRCHRAHPHQEPCGS